MKILLKVIYKIYHKIGFPKFIRIQSGLLKGYFLNTELSDSRYFLGDYENEAIPIFEKNINANNVVLDIGANVGYFSMIFSALAPQ